MFLIDILCEMFKDINISLRTGLFCILQPTAHKIPIIDELDTTISVSV